ncbi:MAG: ImmA/IrrE family metallo-endopeptidase [Parvularcula sp.]|jgi:Zn-dependent peptidase ImmA (M78 family)/transcriptional regulator with XRE-family HTH domain|nr:ImmA/IrrE family metallo-endopeptidase [Parvularcula sp.]
MGTTFNNDLLLLARQYRGRSQAEVALDAGLDQGHYSRIERGILNSPPTDETIEAVAGALGFPKSYFLQNDELSGLPLSVHDAAWRKRSSVKAGELKRLHAELNLRIMHIRRYLQSVEVKSELPLPSWDADDFGGADVVAHNLRRAWMVPPGPIKSLTALCERAGILVIQCDFAEKIDGVTMWLRDVPPLIFLNKNSPPDRMRHSLAHELGHLIMHRIPTDAMEEEADLFAGELLAPVSELRSDLIGGRITLERLVQLKKYWRVSVASLLYRAGRNGFLTANQSSYLWRQLSARGWKKREPEETQFAPEEARLYQHVLTLHQDELGYDLYDIASMLHLSTNDVRALYGITASPGVRRNFHVVK